MNIIRKHYFPNLCISFTFVIIYVSINNILGHNDPIGYHVFVLQLIGYLILAYIIIFFIQKLEYKHWFLQDATIFIINYILFIVTAYFFHWFRFRISMIIINTLLFLLIFIFVTFHSYKIMKQDEEKINKLLEIRDNISE